jgi:hypothetical protein
MKTWHISLRGPRNSGTHEIMPKPVGTLALLHGLLTWGCKVYAKD